MTFSGCERIKNSLGLVKPANVENPESPENSNKSESPTNKTDCKRRFKALDSSYLLSKKFAIKAAAVVGYLIAATLIIKSDFNNGNTHRTKLKITAAAALVLGELLTHV